MEALKISQGLQNLQGQSYWRGMKDDYILHAKYSSGDFVTPMSHLLTLLRFAIYVRKWMRTVIQIVGDR